MRVQVAYVALASWSLAHVRAHPLCLNESSPSKTFQQSLSFCTEVQSTSANSNGSCCDASAEADVKKKYYDIYTLSEACKPLQEQVACGTCNPFSAHLFDDGTGIMMMTTDFCNKLKSSTTLKAYFTKLSSNQLGTQPTGMFMNPKNRKWWYINQRGQIHEVDNSPTASSVKTVLDISGRVTQGGRNGGGQGELGLLGLAFSPDFVNTGFFYVNYVDKSFNTNVSRFKHSHEKGVADPNSETSELAKTTNQPYYHLYIVTGDGGSAFDPQNHAQDLNSRLGKIMRVRISTDAGTNSYTTPPDNPSIKGSVTRNYAYGLRNPWKCTFNRANKSADEIWCGDVGQDHVEKVIKIKAGGNHGWNYYEGTRQVRSPPANFDYVKPVFEYCHSNEDITQCKTKDSSGKTVYKMTGQSVTGGFVYSGTRQNDQYAGQYIYADYQQGRIARLYYDSASGTWKNSVIVQSAGWTITALAEDLDGEIYIMRYGDSAQVYALPDKQTESGGGGSPTPDPTCKSGIKSGSTCCSSTCGTCSGLGCDTRDGGRTNCCTSGIKESNRICTTVGAPCMIPARRVRDLLLNLLDTDEHT
ncbi:Sorbosone dehydrogenase-domain-containing protein [Tribonema minus]|uniref:Sorbosone dehydrogenase-domain-containing protein n=1 Tax=Tribonema minus TaxID=303371 RepID=A0A836CJ59_9STRA|nr:Sorbosone dehydrogenase-domain-containing protein [Tribonema minus]